MKVSIKRLLAITVIGMAIIMGSVQCAHAAATYEYYPNGRVKSITYDPPEGGVYYVEYLDEDWQGQGHGRVSRQVNSTPDGDGAISYVYDYALDTELSSANLNGAAVNDLVVMLGDEGTYRYMGSSSGLTQISPFTAESVYTADLDGGIDDVVADFGSLGLYKYMNNAGGWRRIATLNAENVIVWDIDGNGQDDILADFGSFGFYRYMNNSSTATRLTTLDAENVIVTDLDNGGASDIVADFGSFGLYKYMNNAGGWIKLTTLNAEKVVGADLDADTRGEIIADFGAFGLYKYMNNSTVPVRIATLNADDVMIGDLDDNGQDDIVADFGSFGFFKYMNDSGSWVKLTTLNADNMIVADLDNNGQDDILADFGSFGLFRCMNNAAGWTRLTTLNAENVVMADLDDNGQNDIVADFGSFGLYTCMNGALGWSKITTLDAVSLEALDLDDNGQTDIVADFGLFGLYKYMNNASWIKVTGLNADRVDTEYAYSNTDYTDLVYTAEYNSSGTLVDKIYESTPGETYYGSGRIESRTLDTPDGSNSVYYHFIDEDFQGSGQGRVDYQVLDSADTEGALAYRLYYHDSASSNLSKKELYSGATIANPSSPSVAGLITTYTYYNATYNRLESKTLETPDANGKIYYHYADEPGIAPAEAVLHLDGDDYLSVGDSADWDFGTGDWTIDFWVKFSAKQTVVLFESNSYTNGIRIAYRDDLAAFEVYINNTQYVCSWVPTVNVWNNIAVVRDGNELKVFIDGVQAGMTHDVTGKDIAGLTAGMRIGAGIPYPVPLNGYMSDFRISDTARYSSSFTPATGLTNDANTLLLLNLDEAAGSTSWTDSSSSGYTVSATGDPVQAETPGRSQPGENGRVDVEVLDEAEDDGVIAYEIEYHEGTEIKSRMLCYGNAIITDPDTPLLTDLLREFLYNTSGLVIQENDYINDKYYLYDYYTGDNWDKVHYKEEYDSTDTLLRTYEYDTDGNLIRVIPGAGGSEEYYAADPFMLMRKTEAGTLDTYEYLNEDWNGQGWGRVTLLCDISEGTYSTYDWGAEQATINVYDGAYLFSTGDNVRVGIVPADRIETYFYDHNGTQDNLDTATNGWVMRRKTVYDPVDGVTVLADYHYDTSGRMVREDRPAEDIYYTFTYRADLPSTLESKSEYEYSTDTLLNTYTYMNDTYFVKEVFDPSAPDTGSVYTYFTHGGTSYTNTCLGADGTFTEYRYNEWYGFVGADKCSADRSVIEKYDAGWNLTMRKDFGAGNTFAKGTNMPWNNYGYDIGICTIDSVSHMGYSSDPVMVFERMNERKGDFMRVFLFNDMRSGVTFDGSGNPTGFTDKVYEDMQILVDTAELLGIKLIPVLLDFKMADGVSYESAPVGEHPDCITDGSKRAALISLMGDFVSYFSDEEAIYAWEIMNEPEEIVYEGEASWLQMQTFVKEAAAELHLSDTDTPVTLGAQDRLSLAAHWTDGALGEACLDIYQYHYYNRMEYDSKPLDYAASNFDKPTLIGEIDPTIFEFFTDSNNNGVKEGGEAYEDDNLNGQWDSALYGDVLDKIDNIFSNGYTGALFWEDDSAIYTISDQMYADIKNWLYGQASTSEEFYDPPSNRLKRKVESSGNIYEYLDEDWNSSGYGRVVLAYTQAEASYNTYSWDDPVAGQVTLETYSGAYTTASGSDVLSGVVDADRRDTFIYDHNDEQQDLDTVSNGWIMRYHGVYTTDGNTLMEEYTYDPAGRLTRDDQVQDDRYYTYQYFSSPNQMLVNVKREYELSTGALIATYTYNLDGDIISIVYGSGWTENYTDTGYLKRKVETDGDVYEYLNEDYLAQGQGYGRMRLAYANASNIYNTYTWGINQVTVNGYTGGYSPEFGSDLLSAVVPGDRNVTYVYDHKGEERNLDTGTNGWVMRNKKVYDTDGSTVLEEYVYYASGRLQSKELQEETDPGVEEDLQNKHVKYYLNDENSAQDAYGNWYGRTYRIDNYTDNWYYDITYANPGVPADFTMASKIRRDMDTGEIIPYDGMYPSGFLKRDIQANGDIYEYADEDWNLRGYGRFILEHKEAENTYKTWEWDTPVADEQVTVTEYAGDYVVGLNDPALDDVDTTERTMSYVYDHNGEQESLDTASNGWVMRNKKVYDTGGVTVLEEYVYYASGRLETNEQASDPTTDPQLQGKNTKYYLYDENHAQDAYGSWYGRTYRIDNYTDNWYYEITYANPGDPADGTIASQIKRDLTTGEIIDEDGTYPSGNMMRKIEENGDITEYMDENWNNRGYGRLLLFYDADQGVYKTWDWDTPVAGHVEVTEYLGTYTAGINDDIRVDVVDSEKTVRYSFEHYGEQENLDTGINGWHMKKKEDYVLGTGAWQETIWYRENGNPFKKLKPDGEAAIFFDDGTWRSEVYWASGDTGKIERYPTADDSDGPYYSKEWQINAGYDYMTVFEIYEGTRRYEWEHRFFWDEANSRWGWAWSKQMNDTGGIPYGNLKFFTDTTRPTTVKYPSGVPQYITTFYPDADLEKPVRSDLESLYVDNVAGAEPLSDDMVELFERIKALQGAYSGEGVTVALLDSGVNEEKLDIDLVNSVSFADGFSYDVEDVLGHGTKTTGIISDTAKDAGIMVVKVMNDDAETSSSILSEAIKYAVDMGARVLAMPLSLYPVSEKLEAAIDYAVSKGAILIASAGNEGAEVLKNSLASQKNVITVGSVDNDGKLSAWSNIGGEVDLYAPWDVIDNEEQGTSYSAALVAGLAALVLEDSPDMTADDVLGALKSILGPVTEKIDENKEIKGENVSEVVDMYEMLRKNRRDFTGNNIVEDVPEQIVQ